MKPVIILTVALAAVLPAHAHPYPTIVGEWYAEEIGPQDCGGPHSVHIAAMRYVEEAMICRFTDVIRDGWRVTWTGSCSDGSSAWPMRLVATEAEGRLTLSFNGTPGWSALRRCTAKSARAPITMERVPLVYTAYAADSEEARAYWGDALTMVAEFDPPPVVPLSVHVAEEAGLVFAYVTGGGACGTGHGCPERVFQDGEKLGEFTACDNLDAHAVSIDGSRFYDCYAEEDEGRPILSLSQ